MPDARFVASDWKPHAKNTLLGFFTLTMPSGLLIKECSYHERDGKRWVSFPGKPYRGNDGETKYANIIEIFDKAVFAKFQEYACAAVEAIKP